MRVKEFKTVSFKDKLKMEDKGGEAMYTLMLLQAKMKLMEWSERFLKEENGDTNFISILIVLGIVIVLVVFFQNQLTNILNTVKGQVGQFTGFTTPN